MRHHRRMCLDRVAHVVAVRSPLADDGSQFVSPDGAIAFAEVRYDEDLAVHHGLLRFRAVTEPDA